MSQLHESAKDGNTVSRNRESRPYRTARDAQAAVLYGLSFLCTSWWMFSTFRLNRLLDFTVVDFTGNAALACPVTMFPVTGRLS